MAQDASIPEGSAQTPCDFFISYAQPDVAWAIWIAGQLEQAGYRVFVQAWDIRPGHNRVLMKEAALEQAGRVLLLLSPDYRQDEMSQSEWAAAFADDQAGTSQSLLP